MIFLRRLRPMERQCDAVRRLHRQHGGDAEAIIAALAAGLGRGEIRRDSNTHGWSDQTYARALYGNYQRRGLL
jgi:hypothetical protein